MERDMSAYLPVTCDCDHNFAVTIVRHALSSMEVTCPDCGRRDRFTPDQVKSIATRYERTEALAWRHAQRRATGTPQPASAAKRGAALRGR